MRLIKIYKYKKISYIFIFFGLFININKSNARPDLGSRQKTETSNTAKNQLEMLQYHLFFGEGLKKAKILFKTLLEKKEFAALNIMTQYYYNAMNLFNGHEKNNQFQEIIDITRIYYEKTSEKIVGQFLACMLVGANKTEEAIKLFKKNETKENPCAEIFALFFIKKGNDKHQDFIINLLEKQNNNGSLLAGNVLGQYLYDLGEKNKGLEILENTAEKGDKESAQILCKKYLTEEKIIDKDRALYFAKKGYKNLHKSPVVSVEYGKQDWIKTKDNSKTIILKFEDGSIQLPDVEFNMPIPIS